VDLGPADDLSWIVDALEQTGEYRALRRLAPRKSFFVVEPGQKTRTALLLDVETTGLDPKTAEVIELGMVKFIYADDKIAQVIDTFGSFNEPEHPIPPEITALTEITNEMVVGHRIDPVAVSTFIADVNVVIAHNAAFDRKFSERYWPEFEHKPWACSVSEIQWRAHGFQGSRLAYLLMGAGLFHKAHRAVDDCHALLEILAMPLGNSGRSAFAHLLECARRNTVRLWAEGTPYDSKDILKKRGYRWNDGNDGRPRSWYVEIDHGALADELALLRREIYQHDVELYIQSLTAMTRFSSRM